jgi:hypothetical protein
MNLSPAECLLDRQNSRMARVLSCRSIPQTEFVLYQKLQTHTGEFTLDEKIETTIFMDRTDNE